MIPELFMLGFLSAAVALILSSSWLVTRWAYYAILALVAATLAIGEIPGTDSVAGLRPLIVLADMLLFGVLFYFITVQMLMGRKVTAITSRDEFRGALEQRGEFNLFARFLYYLPWVLLAGMIAVALLGAYIS
jgi:hypothetical protein